jgi:hypothetical protein
MMAQLSPTTLTMRWASASSLTVASKKALSLRPASLAA